MGKEIHTFDRESINEIAREIRRLWNQTKSLARFVESLRSVSRDQGGLEIRSGITTTNTKHPTYPTDGCQFVVQFESWEFDRTTVGHCDPITASKWQARYEVARTYDGKHIDEGTRVIIVRIAGSKGARWWIIPLPKFELRRFELTDDLTMGSNAAAEFLDGNLVKTGEALVVHDTVGEWHGLEGYHGWAIFKDDEDRWEIVFLESPSRFIEGTLVDDLSGGSARISITDDYGSAPNGKTPDGTVWVHDRQGVFKYALAGAKCKAIYDEQDTDEQNAPLGKWVVWICDQRALRFKSKLNGCLEATDASTQNWNSQLILPTTYYPFGQTPVFSETVALVNEWAKAGSSGDDIEVAWDETGQYWYIDEVKQKEVELPTEFRSKAGGCGLEYKTQKFSLHTSGVACSGETWRDLGTWSTVAALTAANISRDEGTAAGSGDDTCTLTNTSVNICVPMAQVPAAETETVYTFPEMAPLITWEYDTSDGCFKWTQLRVSTVCTHDVVDYTDCDTEVCDEGSGSTS